MTAPQYGLSCWRQWPGCSLRLPRRHSRPVPFYRGEPADFLTTGQFARRLSLSRETVRRLAIADVLPHAVVCRGARKTTRRFPRRFADDFAASGLDVDRPGRIRHSVARVRGRQAMTAGLPAHVRPVPFVLAG